MQYKLSICIPARNEMWLNRTIQDILENKEEATEIIVALDGQWGTESIPQHKDLTVVYFPESIGQRAATNRCVSLSSAKYIMKLDAHCKMDKGFDRKLIEDMDDNWTVVPAMKNLHVFDWVCECGFRKYQGPTIPCPKCGKEMKRDIKWYAKPSPYSTSYRFNNQLEFKYFGEYKAKQKGDIVDTMSLQGSCFMLMREKYWDLKICDESWGSWGGQGAEVSIKARTSGMEVKVNKKTWYAHLFRTQGGDFGFPYKNPGSEQKKAKNTLRDTFLNNKWEKQIMPLSKIIDKFYPVPDWSDEDILKLKEKERKQGRFPSDTTRGIIFYTDNQLNLKIAHKVQKRLRNIGLPITSTSLKPMKFGNNIVVKGKSGIETYYKQIITALENAKEDIVYFCEHDVLYNHSHFEFTPPERNKFYFNTHVWKVDWETGKGLWVDDLQQVSGIVCYREFALKYYKEKSKDKHFEPNPRENFKSKEPIYDIRHNNNLTPNRWKKSDFKNKKYTKGWKIKNNII